MQHIVNLILLLVILGASPSVVIGQNDSIPKSLVFNGDFRFRIEHDWKSRKQDGTYRDDRSRIRYRFRFGVNYQLNKQYSFGGRLRTGNINDQQGPHVTIGGGNGEFGLTQIGLEKLYFKVKKKWFFGWIGKNDILMEKQNELFWNDNVFPEGLAIGLKWNLSHQLINSIQVNSGHYIIKSNGKSFDQDSYLQLIQITTKHWQKRWSVFPAFYFFNQIGYIPDGKLDLNLSYSIFHLGTNLRLLNKPNLNIGFDFYNNFQDYSDQNAIPLNLRDQKKGIVISTKLGKLKDKGDWIVQLYYAQIQKFAIVDYFAQNDWVRWDYSSFNAAGSRISNFKGWELRVGYNIEQNLNLILRVYTVEELIAQGTFSENGNRIRLDLNIRF